MRGFLLIVGAGLASAALGAGFGGLVGWLSPELMDLVAHPYPVASAPRLGAALGMIAGLILGAAAMAFALLVEALRARPRSGALQDVGAGAGER